MSKAHLNSFQKLVADTVDDPELKSWAISYADVQYARIESDALLVEQQHEKGRLLNVGGAPYVFEYLLKQNNPNIEITSFDVSPERLKDLSDAIDLDVKKVDIEHPLEGGDGVYSTVVFNEVFEHCRLDLFTVMDNLQRLLEPGGLLILTTPNGFSLGNIWKFLVKQRSGPSLVSEWGKLKELGHMGHVREYTLKELSEFFEAAGFKVVSADYRRSFSTRKSLPVMAGKTLEAVVPQIRKNLVFRLTR